ncbi:MAG: LolA-like putative outer membrane lipoprotein chaperone [Alloprevotella sp.]
MKHIFLTLCAAGFMAMSGMAQTARQVLDQAASKIKSAGGIEAAFEATQFKGVQENGTTNGQICFQGNKFKITSPALTTWFDGTTQWTLLHGSDEVNVSTPSEVELQQINPYTFINLYKKGFNLTLNNSVYQGKNVDEVRMQAQSASNRIQVLIVTLDKTSHMPLSIRMKDHKGEWVRIRVSGLKTKRNFSDSTFKFNTKDHPGIEVIDLR